MNRAMGLFILMISVMAGCDDTADVKANPENSAKKCLYVKCVAEFVDYDANYEWFENWTDSDGESVHDDGVCPKSHFSHHNPKSLRRQTCKCVI